jgi:hypothetical protein
MADTFEHIHNITMYDFMKQNKCDIVSFQNGCIVINNLHLLFEPTIAKIKAQITELLKDPRVEGLSYVMLVGEFGESPILQEAINDVIPDRSQLVIPSEPQVSVLTGAVYYGFEINDR